MGNKRPPVKKDAHTPRLPILVTLGASLDFWALWALGERLGWIAEVWLRVLKETDPGHCEKNWFYKEKVRLEGQRLPIQGDLKPLGLTWKKTKEPPRNRFIDCQYRDEAEGDSDDAHNTPKHMITTNVGQVCSLTRERIYIYVLMILIHELEHRYDPPSLSVKPCVVDHIFVALRQNMLTRLVTVANLRTQQIKDYRIYQGLGWISFIDKLVVVCSPPRFDGHTCRLWFVRIVPVVELARWKLQFLQAEWNTEKQVYVCNSKAVSKIGAKLNRLLPYEF